MAGEIDTYDANVDWLHTGWDDWPPYRSAKFYKRIEEEEIDLDTFKLWPIYLDAVSNGLIVDDEWTGAEVYWGEWWLRDDLKIATQIDYRLLHLREEVIGILADAQSEARRALTAAETGAHLLDFMHNRSLDSMEEDALKISHANVGGIEGLVPVDQASTWFGVLSNYSARLFRHIQEKEIALPQIWQKRGARAVYYPRRRLIVVPAITTLTTSQVAHAAAHFIETLGVNGEAIDTQRNRTAFPSMPLHMIRHGLYALRGPWVDQHDGALRGHDPEKLEDWYLNQREFSAGEIRNIFSGRPTEFMAMMAQRVARADPVEIADVWARVPDQLLFYISLSDGNYLEEPK